MKTVVAEAMNVPQASASDSHVKSRHFSLGELLAILSIAAAVLAVGSYCPRLIFVLTLGLATLLATVELSAMREPSALLQLGYWTLVLVYFVATVVAMME